MKHVALLSVVMLCLQSCVLNQEPAESETKPNANSKYIKEVLLKEGYEPGTVKVLKDSDCTFVILNEDTNINLDPINFNISDFEAFRTNGLKVYFKYKPLRMMNRCTDASPIELISIVKKVD